MNLPTNRAKWPTLYKELFEERAGIIEYEAKVSRFTAETRAEQDIHKQAAQEREERTA